MCRCQVPKCVHCARENKSINCENKLIIRCINCKGNHKAFNNICPLFNKYLENISFNSRGESIFCKISKDTEKFFYFKSRRREILKVQYILFTMNHTCHICGKLFRRPFLLKNHIDFVHKSIPPYVCEFCRKSFGIQHHLTRHIETVHRDNSIKDVETHKCETCNGIFSNVQNLKRHLKLHEQNPDKFECKLCDIRFHKRKHLREHMVNEHDKVSILHNCPHNGCDMKFVYLSRLKRHIKVHQGYECHSCTLVLKTWSDLRRHIAKEHRKDSSCKCCGHTIEDPMDKCKLEFHGGRCQFCDAKSNPGKFKCSKCQREFKYSRNLKSHERIEHNDKLSKCDLCGQVFKHSKSLRHHMIIKHVDDHNENKKSYPAKGHRKLSDLSMLLCTNLNK
ncbi:hypothetical protein GJ496_001388 [Pomphorhynchus laevis]|nr:hypothetical protein GJ496_001388 [Pomphorhynchus laevis]